jgi:major membrane immunogen (membrane-anchored lipoprotein)
MIMISNKKIVIGKARSLFMGSLMALVCACARNPEGNLRASRSAEDPEGNLRASRSAEDPAARSSGLADGYYTAEVASFDAYGWKEFVSIYVNNNKIATVEYNAKNESGFIKSWDMDYMRVMNAADGTYPNKYTRAYSVSLLNRQDPHRIDALAGATYSYITFRLLAAAAIAQARAGDKNVALVDLLKVPE